MTIEAPKVVKTPTRTPELPTGTESVKSTFTKGAPIKIDVSNKGKVMYKAAQPVVSNGEDEGSSSEDDEENFPYIQREVHVVCPFGNCKNSGEVFTNPTDLPPHLRLHHQLHFRNLYHMTSALQAYLSHWADRLEKTPLESFLTPQEDENGSFYMIGPETFPEDEKIRHELQQKKLKEILEQQDSERRNEALKEQSCLFCSTVTENRNALFRHMFSEHGFNIGRPDNLVYTDEFLNLLRKKLEVDVCLYCDRTFKSAKVLRFHMRKKKHFRVHSRNHTYDKFYVINYAEPGKTWDVLERENEAEQKRAFLERDVEEGQDSWDDWDEKEAETTLSLFDNLSFDSPAAALAHDKEIYGFDLEATIDALGLDFYKSVTLVNYVRHQSSQGHCITCHSKESDLPAHYTAKKCLHDLTFKPEDSLWVDPTYLVPTIENDPLLMHLNASYDNDEEESAPESHDKPLISNLDPTQEILYAKAADSVSTTN